MPKNKGKGGKNRRRGKNEADKERRDLTFKEDQQEYAQVIKLLGNGRVEAACFDGVRRLALIRGKMRKKVWINQGDIILVAKRSYQDEKGDVILKYTSDEARQLKTYGELPETAKINESENLGPTGAEEDGGEFKFEFTANDDEDDKAGSDSDKGSDDDGDDSDDTETPTTAAKGAVMRGAKPKASEQKGGIDIDDI